MVHVDDRLSNNPDVNELLELLVKWLEQTKKTRAGLATGGWSCPYCHSLSYSNPIGALRRHVYELRHNPNCVVIRTEDLLKTLEPPKRKKAS